MDLVDLLILALRLVFVALLYLFLIVVLRLTIRGLRSAQEPVRSEPRLNLVVLEPGAAPLSPGEVFVVPDGSVLGRGERADLVLADQAISTEHARVHRAGRRWVVTDLGSTNGTRVNDAIVRGRAPLAEGDILALGTVRLQVMAR